MLEVNDGDLVFDVGANSGFFALVLSILVKSNGKVVAVDPDPEFVSQIEDVVRLNNLQNVQVEQVALSNYVGEADFSCGCGSKQRFASKTGINTFKTKVNTLDWLASKCGIPDLVMLDVEGAEGDVLEEAKTILSKRKTKFLIETHERENEKGVGIARRLKATFEAYNYDILSLDRTSPVIDMSRHPDILPHHILALPR